MRDTSLEAYNTIKENGTLSERRMEVYEYLFHNGPLSQMELCYGLRGKLDRALTPRFSELEHMGCITIVDKRLCKITGNNSTIWDVTKNIPRKIIKPKRIKCEHCNGKGHFIQEVLL